MTRRCNHRKDEEVDGVKELAQAIVQFGVFYEKFEGVKQRQMIELEKQRMGFMKNLEFKRCNFLWIGMCSSRRSNVLRDMLHLMFMASHVREENFDGAQSN
ncbi:hypothetical protein FRX31_017845 [Thalictrum thalictroides]|uniref:Uncharacterized protein n=1 Tax=Thalictrum thalictroides TaxID=46969 RepID=A0A7J6W5A9_THATH|nr:hypothetical protein FRX31_017845 [Thalictrum thalictroides]